MSEEPELPRRGLAVTRIGLKGQERVLEGSGRELSIGPSEVSGGPI